MLPVKNVDLLVIGGGINGAGIARDAAGRGLSVLLCEQNDLASATSSASTKLIHGGLRYLEHYEFRLVREALQEREILLVSAPHIIWPLRFVLPHHRGLRPAWLLRLGLFLYDHIGGRRSLPGTRTIDLARDPIGQALRPQFRRAFAYSDCWVDDARLVILNAMAARDRGANILTRTKCLLACRVAHEGISQWRVTLQGPDGAKQEVFAKALVNAAGPWVSAMARNILSEQGECCETAKGPPGKQPEAPRAQVRLVKGSHVITKRLFEGDHAFIFQNADQRIIFAIPYLQQFTLIGTTDVPFSGDPGRPEASLDEQTYLCEAASEYFAVRIELSDVVASYSGVRPLYDDAESDASAVTRDYVLDLDAGNRAHHDAPLISVFGGKITTFRRLAESALADLAPFFGHLGVAMTKPWTRHASLPGAELGSDGSPKPPLARFATLLGDLARDYPFLAPETVFRLARAYGTLARIFLGSARQYDDLGVNFARRPGLDLTEAELIYLRDHEWALTSEDVLRRRTKLGLFMTPAEQRAVSDWFGG